MTDMSNTQHSIHARIPCLARTIVSLAMLCVWSFTAAASADPGDATQIAAAGSNVPGTFLSEQASWKEFGSRSESFRALFPGIPEVSKSEVTTPTGTIVSTRFTVRAGADATYDVMYNDYPKSIVGAIDRETLLDSTRDGLVHQTKGRIASEKKLKLDGKLGREVEIRGLDATLYTVQLVLVDRRLYQVLVIDRKSKTADTRKFLDSFRILGTP